MLAFLVAVLAANRKRRHASTRGFGDRTIQWLSTMKLFLLAAVFVTGVTAAYPLIDQNYAAMFVTDSGWLLMAKLMSVCLILGIELQIHFIALPAFARERDLAAVVTQTIQRWIVIEDAKRILRRGVVIESLLALVLIWAGHVVANDHPPNHAVVYDWPYPFRFSIANTWGMGLPDVVLRIWIAIIILMVAGGIALLGQIKHWKPSRRLGLPIALASVSVGVGLQALTVEAYPETYRPTPIPFKAKSIDHGMTLFAENCVPCHGPQAKGDGVLAKTLAKQPVDLLTEPHASMHTPGDLFHWLTNGIPGTGMPAWGERFSVEERWDLVNLVHALSRGYQARIISPRILPNQPYLAPPGFAYTDHDRRLVRLKDFRGEKALLLVLFSWPESHERLNQLRSAYPVLRDHKAEVLAIPLTALTPQESGLIKGLPFPLVGQDAVKIARTYSLFRRTISHPDLMGQGIVPKHMEFLLDRFGYLRARWIPETDGGDWTDIDFLTQQMDQLNQEPEILPPPADYVQETTNDMKMDRMKM